MKKTITLLTGIIIILTCPLSAYAESITVSCTIPAIPGVNVPYIEEKTVRAQDDPNTQDSQPQDEEPAEEKEGEKPSTLQEESNDYVLLANGKNTAVIVQTLYCR